jgi:hypothetical protein
VKNRFQNLPFKFQLAALQRGWLTAHRFADRVVGLYTLNPAITRSLKASGFNPLKWKTGWLQAFVFECSLYRYGVRYELVHCLAVSPHTHSELSELLPANLASEQADVDKVLHEVAVYEPPRTLDDKGKYRLKDEMWGEFDGFFHRYTPVELEHAMQNAVTGFRKAKLAASAGATTAGATPSPLSPWSPRMLLAAPSAPPPPFTGLLRFTRHPSMVGAVQVKSR